GSTPRMSAADGQRVEGGDVAPPPRETSPSPGEARFRGEGARRRRPARFGGWPALVVGLFAAAFLLRIVGFKTGLPYVYNADENSHFVPRAIGMFGHSPNPDYFINPPAYTYLLHVLYAVWWGGRDAV